MRCEKCVLFHRPGQPEVSAWYYMSGGEPQVWTVRDGDGAVIEVTSRESDDLQRQVAQVLESREADRLAELRWGA